MQIITGAKRLGWMDDDITSDEETNKQVLVIWVITLIATMSVVSGLSVGIKLLSQVGFGLGMIRCSCPSSWKTPNSSLIVWCRQPDTVRPRHYFTLAGFLAPLSHTSLSYALHVTDFQFCIFQVPFWTDAFGGLQEGEGRAVDGNSASATWMEGWSK